MSRASTGPCRALLSRSRLPGPVRATYPAFSLHAMAASKTSEGQSSPNSPKDASGMEHVEFSQASASLEKEGEVSSNSAAPAPTPAPVNSAAPLPGPEKKKERQPLIKPEYIKALKDFIVS